jgi:hypothetical protein
MRPKRRHYRLGAMRVAPAVGPFSIKIVRMVGDTRHLAASDVPLSEDALRLLGDQMGGRGKNPFVFPGRPRAPLSSMALAMLLRRMGIDVTVHGFDLRQDRGWPIKASRLN